MSQFIKKKTEITDNKEMHMGSHFGKRKPGWNFFNEKALLYFESIESSIFKMAILSAFIQFIFLTPLLFWTIENYNFFLKYVPLKTDLKENFASEKNWIIFLYAFSFVATIVVNYLFTKKITQKYKSSAANLHPKIVSDISFVEAADQHRVA